MFHVFRVLPPGFSQNFLKSQSLYRGKARIFSESQISYSEGRHGIFLSPGGYIESQSLYRGKSSEFFQVLGPIQRGRCQNFSKSQNLCSRRYFLIFSTYFFIFSAYFFTFSRYFFIIRESGEGVVICGSRIYPWVKFSRGRGSVEI